MLLNMKSFGNKELKRNFKSLVLKHQTTASMRRYTEMQAVEYKNLRNEERFLGIIKQRHNTYRKKERSPRPEQDRQ